jgi:hypothetical protein
MSLTLPVPCGAAAIAGYAIWLLYFHRYETHLHGGTYLSTFILSCVGGFVALTRLYAESPSDAAAFVAAVATSFSVGAYGSMLVWRAFLNPLNKLPGPWPARLGNLWFSFHVAKSDAYYRLQDLHRKYGRIVRIGSNDLSITDPTIFQASYGQKAEVTKGTWYDNDAPMSSMSVFPISSIRDSTC